jgi:aminoglycoside phosphotransferase (APT) family kinase protein
MRRRAQAGPLSCAAIAGHGVCRKQGAAENFMVLRPSKYMLLTMDIQSIKAAILGHYPSVCIAAVKRLEGGVSAGVFQVDLCHSEARTESLVLRTMGKSGLPSDQEFALLRFLHGYGFPVPHPLLVDNSQSALLQPYLLMEFVKGSTGIDAEKIKPAVSEMANQLAQIHAIPSELLPKLPARLNPLENLLDMMPIGLSWQAAREFFAPLQPCIYQGTSTLLHGDFWPNNLIWQGDKIAAVLDWEDAALGDPLSDVAVAALELSYLYDEEVVAHFIACYKERLPIDPYRLALWKVYVASAAQHYMDGWGLSASKTARMRAIALSQIQKSTADLIAGTV